MKCLEHQVREQQSINRVSELKSPAELLTVFMSSGLLSVLGEVTESITWHKLMLNPHVLVQL
jgi:hypothetical protein